MLKRQHKSVSTLATVADANLLRDTDIDAADFPDKVVMRRMKWSDDPRFRLNLQKLKQPRPATKEKIREDKVKRPVRLASLAVLQAKIPRPLSRLPPTGITRPALGVSLAHIPKQLTPLKSNGTLLDASYSRFASRLRLKA